VMLMKSLIQVSSAAWTEEIRNGVNSKLKSDRV
jgi:hypothetical protein